MRILALILTTFICFNALAAKDYGETYQLTLQAKKKIDKNKLDPIGGKILNKYDQSVLMGHCTQRLSSGDCEIMNYVLEIEGIHYKVYDSPGHEASVNMRVLKDRLGLGYWNSVRSFAGFDDPYQRAPGDFTGLLGMMCIYEPASCALLVLLPVSIAADLIMLPIDLGVPFAINNIERHRAKKIHKIFGEKNEEIKVMGHRKFQRLLDNSLSI